MPCAVLGEGPRTMLVIPGGPGSAIPDGPLARLTAARGLQDYLDGGFTIWTVARRRGMPERHTMADIAADHAQFVREEMGGHVDVVLGQSFGGLVALQLAADHPEVSDRYVLAGSAAHLSPWCVDIEVSRCSKDGMPSCGQLCTIA